MAIDFPRSIYTVAEGVSLRGWSSSPANGDSNTHGGKTYTYSSTQSLWILSTGFTHSAGGKTYSWDGEKWIAQTAIPYIYHGPLTTANKPTGLGANDAGDLYFNTTDDKMQVWSGSAWEDISVTTIGTDVVSTSSIQNDAVTYAKMQNVSGTNRVLGRDSPNGGNVEEITPSALRTMINVADGANLYTHPNHSGEVTSTGDGATVIANNVVDEANLKINNNPTDDHVLTADSSASGGLTWKSVGSIQASVDRIESSDSDLIVIDGSNAHIKARLNSTDVFRIDVNGKTGLGTTVPGSYWAQANNLVVEHKTGETTSGISIVGEDRSIISFADGTSSAARKRGYLQYNHLVSGVRTDTLNVGAATAIQAVFCSGGLGLGNAFTGGTKTSTSTPLEISNTSNSIHKGLSITNNEGGFDLATDGGSFIVHNGLTANGNFTQKFKINEAGKIFFGSPGNVEKFNFDDHLSVEGLVSFGLVNDRGMIFDKLNGRNFIKYDDNSSSTLPGGGVRIHGKNVHIATNNAKIDCARFDNSGRFIIGNNIITPRFVNGLSHRLQVYGSDSNAGISIERNSADNGGATLSLGKLRSTDGTYTTPVADNDYLGVIAFNGADGNDLTTQGAAIACRVDGTVSSNTLPAELYFYTNDGNGSTADVQLILTKEGNLRPQSNGTKDLGHTSYKWKNFYLYDKAYNRSDYPIISGETGTFNYYVSDSGDDSTGNGTSSSPWRTINKALAQIPRVLSYSQLYKIRVQGSSYTPTGSVTCKGFQGPNEYASGWAPMVNIRAETAGCTWDLNSGSLFIECCTAKVQVERFHFQCADGTSAGRIQVHNCQNVDFAGTNQFTTGHQGGWAYSGGIWFSKCKHASCYMDFNFTANSTGGLGAPIIFDNCQWAAFGGDVVKAGTQHSDHCIAAYNGTNMILSGVVDNFTYGILLGANHYGAETGAYVVTNGWHVKNCNIGISSQVGSHFKKRSVTFTNNTTNESTASNGYIQ